MNNKHDYKIIRSTKKYIRLEVKNGELLVRAPQHVSNTQIDSVVNDHWDWIKENIEKQKTEQKAAPKQQKLTPEELNRLREQARQVIPDRVRFYAEKIGVTYGQVKIRCQHTRWGSCSSRGNLNFNCLLMMMPPEALDCVVVHELCHRIEMNHSPRFYNEVYKAYPDYDKWNSWLRENGTRFLNMLP